MSKQIDLAPLVVADHNLAVASTVGSAPRGLMLRELIMNGMEAGPARGETVRQISIVQRKIKGHRGDKLAVINTGQGMDDTQLKKMADLNSTTKASRGIRGRSNRGEGAKIASLKYNPQGMSFVSRASGQVHEVLLVHRNGIWGRHKEAIGKRHYEVWIPEDHHTDALPKGDSTMVTLYGPTRDHSTVMDPYGVGAGSTQAIGDEIFGRFYTFSGFENVPLPVKVGFDGTAFGGQSELVPVADILAANPDDYTRERVTLDDGLAIEYVHAKTAPMFPSKLHSGSARCAIVWHGEMYDGISKIDWIRSAVNVGLMGLGKNVSVFVHIPNDYQGIHASKYRDFLQYPNGDTVRCRDFEATIFANRPEWLRKLNATRDANSPLLNSVDKRLDAFAQKLNTKLSENGMAPIQTRAPNASENKKRTPVPKVEDEAEIENAEKAPRAPRAAKGAPSAVGRSIVVKPKVLFQNGADDCPDLTARAACFSRPANTIFINLINPVFEECVEDVINLALTDDKGAIRAVRTADLVEAAKDRVKMHIYEQVAMVVMRNLSHQGSADWDSSEIDRALDKEALHNVVMASLHGAGLLSRNLINSQAGLDARNEYKAQIARKSKKALPAPQAAIAA